MNKPMEQVSTRSLRNRLVSNTYKMASSFYQSDCNPEYEEAHDMIRAIKREILKRATIKRRRINWLKKVKF
jgi:hypothetical protein